jgi:uncharacterized phage protein (TIGR01671 family)
MREIRFRSWNSHHQKMTYSKDWELQKQPYGTFDQFFTPTDHCHFMQYTGLKDCQGVEIYEGDVVIHDEINKVGVVIYEPTRFRIDYIKKNVVRSHLGFMKGILVIGNIYENPELVEVKG